ncbi:hypothetical protein [Pseudomonas sp. IT-347P]|uniref:hypothetical protein n=1 Tax=Pseudomonas sp. IT-347P TaxID=3026458 RepID=UPI0039E0B57D
MNALKQLNSINLSGYGVFISSTTHEVLGVGIYQLNFGCEVFRIFKIGFSILSEGAEKSVFFKDIIGIKSNLNASIFSEASEKKDFYVSLPLCIETSEDAVVIEVPLLIYSRLLIFLNKMCELHKA